MKPRRRTSATSRHRGDLGRAARRAARIFGCRRSSVRSLSKTRGWRAPPRRRAGCRCRCGRGRRSALLGRAEEALVDPLGGQRRGQRQVAAGQALGEAQQVRRDALLLAGEHRPGAAEAGRHLVADQQHAVRGRRARGPRAGSRAGGRACRRRPGPAARRSPRRPRRACGGEDAAPGRAASPGSARVGRRTAAGRTARGRGRCRRPTPSRSCRRGRRREADEAGAPACSPPRCCQYWKAIFSAISTAVEPESE